MTNSLRAHFEKTQAAKAIARANSDPRLSAQVRRRRAGTTMIRQAEPVIDAPSNADTNPDRGCNIELKFYNDWEHLSNIQSIAHKNELKAEFLPHYLPWIEGTIADGFGPQNDMLVKLMVWCLDTHDFKTATDISQYALLNDFVMPEPFTRDVATVFVEQLSDELIKNIDNTTDYADQIQRAIDVTIDKDMPDQVRAKLFRALGDSLKDTKPADAIDAYEKAIKLDDSVGCKKDLGQLRKSSE